MMDLRYHVVTLVAIFLALAAGFVLGASVTPWERQVEAIAGLKSQMDLLREQDSNIKEENRRLQQLVATWERSGRDLEALLLRGRLAGQRVGILICGANVPPAYWPQLRAALGASGATTGPTAYLPDDPKTLDDADQSRFATLWEQGARPAVTGKYQPVVWLLRALHEGGYSQRIQELGAASGIRVEGLAPDPVRRFLVLVAPPDDVRVQRAAHRDVPEAAAAHSAEALGIRLVLAEGGDTLPSQVGNLARRSVAAVDNADSALGEIAIVLALAGADGRFGVKPSATAALPPIAP